MSGDLSSAADTHRQLVEAEETLDRVRRIGWRGRILAAAGVAGLVWALILHVQGQSVQALPVLTTGLLLALSGAGFLLIDAVRLRDAGRSVARLRRRYSPLPSRP